MSDHFHHGSSKGQKSRKLAEDEAIRSWASFTAFEYGETWANFKIAGSKQMNCGPEGGAWGCTTSARPCKAAGPQRKGKS